MKNSYLIFVLALLFHIYIFFNISQSKNFYLFFNHDYDYQQFKNLSHKTINHCVFPWKDSSKYTRDPKTNAFMIFSPSEKFYALIDEQKIGGQLAFRIYNSKTNEVMLKSSHDTKGFDFRWTLDENYVIYTLQVYDDDDWDIPELYIGNIKTGHNIYLADAQYSNCEYYERDVRIGEVE